VFPEEAMPYSCLNLDDLNGLFIDESGECTHIFRDPVQIQGIQIPEYDEYKFSGFSL
jgi:hypothetical protein